MFREKICLNLEWNLLQTLYDSMIPTVLYTMLYFLIPVPMNIKQCGRQFDFRSRIPSTINAIICSYCAIFLFLSSGIEYRLLRIRSYTEPVYEHKLVKWVLAQFNGFLIKQRSPTSYF
ncbi:hypothetical protein ACOME3_008853 [Neoechinorhynchus agilis]